MNLKWSKHAVERAYARLGAYGMSVIHDRILTHVNDAVETVGDCAKIPFILGPHRCYAVVKPNFTGNTAVVVTVVRDDPTSKRTVDNLADFKREDRNRPFMRQRPKQRRIKRGRPVWPTVESYFLKEIYS